jgi:hypothetical protein
MLRRHMTSTGLTCHSSEAGRETATAGLFHHRVPCAAEAEHDGEKKLCHAMTQRTRTFSQCTFQLLFAQPSPAHFSPHGTYENNHGVTCDVCRTTFGGATRRRCKQATRGATEASISTRVRICILHGLSSWQVYCVKPWAKPGCP